MRQNKASRSNAFFLKLVSVLGVLLIVCVIVMLYLSYQNSKNNGNIPQNYKYDIAFSNLVWGDSLKVAVNDSVVFDGKVLEGVKSETYSPGNDYGNMISIYNYNTDITVNYNLPDEGSYISVFSDADVNGVDSIYISSRPFTQI